MFEYNDVSVRKDAETNDAALRARHSLTDSISRPNGLEPNPGVNRPVMDEQEAHVHMLSGKGAKGKGSQQSASLSDHVSLRLKGLDWRKKNVCF
jgi:hypothetical protein